MKTVLIKEDNATFRVPPKIQVELIREGKGEMFVEIPWEVSAFAVPVIRDSIQDPEKDFAGFSEEPWGWFNSFGANTEHEVLYQEHFELSIGKRWREDELLIQKLRNKEGFEGVEIDTNNFFIEKDGRGEHVVIGYEGSRTH